MKCRPSMRIRSRSTRRGGRQADDVVVEVAVAGGPAPGLVARGMNENRAGRQGQRVGRVDIVDIEADLGAGGVLDALGLVERKMQEGALAPGQGRVPAADPSIAGHMVVTVVQVDPE